MDRAIRDARAGRYSVLLVWALDRLAREGPLNTLQVVDRFAKLGVQVVSHQEPWTEASGELRDLLLVVCLRNKLVGLRRGVFTSVPDLIAAIELWAAHWNLDPKPFVWHKPAAEIIEKVRRGRATLHQIKSATDH